MDAASHGRPQSTSRQPNSPSPPPSGSPAHPPHRRGYQACDPCRKRKVKCDLGSVDNPRPPPCVRCRRESKRCEFSATRRKRKLSDVEDPPDGQLRRDKRMMVGEVVSNGTPSEASSYTQPPQPEPATFENNNNNNSNINSNNNALHPPQKWTESSPAPPAQLSHPAPAPTPSYQAPAQSSRPTRYPIGDRFESGQPMMNRTAVELLSPAISNSHDALHLLSEAAGRTEDLNRQSLENRYAAARQSVSSFNAPMSPMTQAGTPRSAGGSFSRPPRSGGPMSMGGNPYHSGSSGDAQVASEARGQGGHHVQDAGFVDAVKAWSRLRFVRAGWLSVEECMAYVAHYYDHLAPLSPIVIPDFSHPSTHRTLLTDEPVLAVTILTTASRHMKPKGDGAYTRAFYIHDRLWSYLRGMIERLFWGQEKFGGSGMGISGPRSFDLTTTTSAKANSKGNLRSLGSIEALLVLTDWHPRNLHFPPGDDENALLDVDAQTQGRLDQEVEAENSTHLGGSSSAAEGRLAFQKWLEPAWRSDRMSWMLLSTAQALAFELGVFDQKSESKIAGESPAEQTRKRRLRRLILVYITQSSGRLGIPSMLPLPQWTNDIQPTSSAAGPKDGDTMVDRMHDLWIGVSKIMYQSNQLLFASNEQTSELIRSGRYRDQIDRFQPFLREWRHNVDTVELAPAMRSILMIEYEYTRLYVNSLALQAVVDRWTTMSNEAAQAKPGSTSGSGWFQVLMELYRVNEQYIQEVVDASRRILTIVLESLVPGEHLKHTPVRTCFRILSGMIFILKTFTLGAKEDDVRVSLDLQDRVIEALRTHVVDDVHLSHAISRLLELLTTSIRTRFLRFAPMDRAGEGDAWTPAPTVGYMDGNGNNNNNSNAPPMGSSSSDPLAGIPAQPINSSNINVSFMPPPPSVYYNYLDPNATTPGAGGGGGGGGGGSGGDMDGSSSAMPSQGMNDHSSGFQDWFALPLDQFFNSSTAVVDQGLGGTGPMVGELDMLEVLLNEQYDGNTSVMNGEES